LFFADDIHYNFDREHAEWPARDARRDQASTLPISNIGIPAFFDFFPADIWG
jgi:hypothetical protein